MDKERKLKRVYTLSMCEFLQEKGFEPVKTLPDLRRPDFLNWLFVESADLVEAMAQFSAARREERRDD